MTKNKHDHTATKKIKAWLFAIMLLLPFLFLLPTGLYYGLNQNAQLSERTVEGSVLTLNGTDNIPQSTVTNTSQLNINTLYNAYIEIMSEDNFIINFNYLELVSIDGNLLYIGNDNENINYQLSQNENEQFIYTGLGNYYDCEETTLIQCIFSIDENTIFTNIEILNFENTINLKEQIGINTTTTNTNDISTSIINAWNSTWQNPLFSWTSYSPFYAPMQSFTNVFGINDMQIANVLTYLATITAIYIVFDIVIELFTYLTHLIPRSD